MIDKSIRQHYQMGDEVKKLGYDVGQKLISPLKEKYLPEGKLDIGEVAKTALTNKLTTTAASKLAGTGILSSLGPIGMIIAMMLARKGVDYAKGKIPKDIGQAFTQGFTGLGVGSSEEQKELRDLEKRRDWMQKRKDTGKSYSKNKLKEVTDQIEKITKPIVYQDKILRDLKLDKDPIIPKITPKSPISYEDDFATTTIEDIINKKVSPISYEDDFATTTIKDIIDSGKGGGADVWDVPTKPTVEDTAAMEDIITAPPKRTITPVYYPHHDPADKPDRGNGGGGKGSSPSDAPGSPFLKGGRVDKALGGRSRDIG